MKTITEIDTPLERIIPRHEPETQKTHPSVNGPAILRIADAIENSELAKTRRIGFNMMAWHCSYGVFVDHTGHGCGTTACVGGWINLFAGRDPSNQKAAANDLEIGQIRASDLFNANGRNTLSDITVADTVRVLRHLAYTGEVDWRV